MKAISFKILLRAKENSLMTKEMFIRENLIMDLWQRVLFFIKIKKSMRVKLKIQIKSMDLVSYIDKMAQLSMKVFIEMIKSYKNTNIRVRVKSYNRFKMI